MGTELKSALKNLLHFLHWPVYPDSSQFKVFFIVRIYCHWVEETALMEVATNICHLKAYHIT